MKEIKFLKIGEITRKDNVPVLEIFLDNILIGYVMPYDASDESYFKIYNYEHPEVTLAKSWFRNLKGQCLFQSDITESMIGAVSKYIAQCIEDLNTSEDYIIYYNGKLIDRRDLSNKLMIKSFAVTAIVHIKNNWR